MVTDTIADFLARMKNGITRKTEVIEVPSTKLVAKIVEILKDEKLILDFEEKEKVLFVKPLYDAGVSLLTKFVKISKPGQRMYAGSKSILPVMNGRGISIVSTSKGLMTGSRAKNQHLGGELICEIW